jgi:apolipoprotein N-acyltransferase
MKKSSWLRLTISVLLAAGMSIAIFPSLDISSLAFICFIPLLLLLHDLSAGKIFLSFSAAGLLFNIGNLYWIAHVIKHYTALNLFLSAGILVLLCLILSLFWGVFGAILAFYRRRSGLLVALLVAPFVWISFEWLRNQLTQFPWCLLGYSQYRNLRFAQTASFSGVYGLSFLLMASNAAITTAFLLKKYKYAAATAITILMMCVYGHFRIQKPVGSDPVLVGCIQGNIPQDVKINFEYADQINRKHIQMTRELIADRHPDLIFWSESSTLFPLRTGGRWTDDILSLARATHTPLIIGSDSFLHRDIYNSAFFVDAAGRIDSQYDKIYLVPFGEYVPLKALLFFAGKVVPEISDFTGGQHYNTFLFKGHKFAIHICFEVVFPQLSREFCLRGSGLLSTITNDAWFGNTSAPYQHFAMAVMRSIETRRYMIRAANTGISGFVDPYGRILQQSDLFVPAKITQSVKWVEEQTFYTRHGDILVYAALFITVAAFFFRNNNRDETRSLQRKVHRNRKVNSNRTSVQ